MNDVATSLHEPSPPQAADVVVVIPFYNGAAFIERALRSVFAQTLPAAEVIVVNDGSAPEQRATLDDMARRFSFRIIDKENGGQGSARNAGVAASTAGFVCFLDQDDFYLETHIETLVNAIPSRDPRFGFVYGDLFEADAAGQTIRMGIVKDHAADHPKRSVLKMIAADMFVLPSAALVTRRAFEAVEGFDEQFMGYEDDDFFLRLFRAGYTNYFVDQPVTVWCIHTASTSFSIRMSRSRFRYFTKLAAMFPDEPLRNRFYMRDFLVPRFGKLFINDVIKRRLRRDPDLPESFQMLDAYGALILANPSIGTVAKLKFRATAWLLKRTPDSVLFNLFRLVDGRILSSVRRLLH
ncbi:MAG: glycosyltransferase family A protein [Variovorax sp.]